MTDRRTMTETQEFQAFIVEPEDALPAPQIDPDDANSLNPIIGRMRILMRIEHLEFSDEPTVLVSVDVRHEKGQGALPQGDYVMYVPIHQSQFQQDISGS
jgi:hypothetical protein